MHLSDRASNLRRGRNYILIVLQMVENVCRHQEREVVPPERSLWLSIIRALNTIVKIITLAARALQQQERLLARRDKVTQDPDSVPLAVGRINVEIRAFFILRTA